MAEKKTTKKEYFAIIREIVAASDHKDKEGILAMIDNEVELLTNKTERGGKKAKEANERTMEIILEVLTDLAKPVTITELMQDARLQTYEKPDKGDSFTIEIMTPQKLTSLVKKLEKDGKVINTVEKKKSYYSVPAPAEEKAEDVEETEAATAEE